ncbi:thiamine-monophosphate kinase [Rhodococcoides trifolii]|uniref:Thiamine-monophosphate kinase n=1 Tax=Rhodococcoides trifolii TaxID=908250 RepID=A0A917D301_9NOCA|nr:thiamine-phosphate kinase [Rhodococcus trifolii]GGG06452.1 thiamine-monophosphate kinase [Rhodococcus trifolii]
MRRWTHCVVHPKKEPAIDALDPSVTVADIGEFALIDRSVRGRVHPPSTLLGPGDDAAVVAAPDGRVVATTDMLMQDKHFRLDWSSPRDIGRKAIAQNGADIAAMGARCTGFLVALGCPSSLSVSVVDELNEGMWEEAVRAGAAVVGGDVVGSTQLVISITALGDLEGRRPVLRSGARPGDVVALRGDSGRSAAGLALLEAGDVRFPELILSHRVPQPHYESGPAAAIAGATSMADISDGLVADLTHIAEASGVDVDLDSEVLTPSDELNSAAESLGLDALQWILTGGEDHALVGTFPSTATLPDGWRRIGRVTGGGGSVTVEGRPVEGTPGWTSF